ncbi:SRPBCC family protein [Pseudotenacibaculum sp. MALMAid0570]|uniref:SRPBCC family protein n=1 Tax=Pseudotenacibaculum sp. MALMAid0570 TaxID=3143938 RepID=UPI0032E04C65
MKAVKIILYILVALTLIFFGTGLVVKESNYTMEIEINKPLSETFKIFNDQSTISEWIPEITKIEAINEKPGITGSEYRITMDNEGQVMTMKEKVLAFVENEKVTLYFDAEGMFKTDDYSFVSEGSKTKIILNVAYQGKSYILNCVFPYFKGTFKGIDQKYLENFKEFAEKQ